MFSVLTPRAAHLLWQAYGAHGPGESLAAVQYGAGAGGAKCCRSTSCAESGGAGQEGQPVHNPCSPLPNTPHSELPHLERAHSPCTSSASSSYDSDGAADSHSAATPSLPVFSDSRRQSDASGFRDLSVSDGSEGTLDEEAAEGLSHINKPTPSRNLFEGRHISAQEQSESHGLYLRPESSLWDNSMPSTAEHSRPSTAKRGSDVEVVPLVP